MSFWNSIASLLTAVLSLLGFAQANPTLPQTQQDQVVQVAQQAISQATNAIASSSTQTASSGFSVSPISGVAPLTVHFTIPSRFYCATGDLSCAAHMPSYSIHYGDNSTDGASLDHTYTTGTYTATLTDTTDNKGSGGPYPVVSTVTISVTENPAYFSNSNLSNPNMASGAPGMSGGVGPCTFYADLKIGDTDNPATGDKVSALQALLGITPTTGYYGARTQIGYENYCNKDNVQPTSVAGMSKYTDSTFGFSFWYPSSWTVQYKDPNGPAVTTYPDGTIKKVIRVSNGNANNIKGVEIDEYNSPAMSITDTCLSCVDSLNWEAVRYYFDPQAGAWMTQSPSQQSTAAQLVWQSAVPADVSNNTMGGLHILSGIQRFQNDDIVPLSAENFLVINSLEPGDPNRSALIDTIVATDPTVATPVSTDKQTAIIRAEAAAYSGE